MATTIDAVRPALRPWTGRGYGTLTFRLMQVVSGHGCFRRFRCRINREQSPGCYHCQIGEEDTA